MSSTKLKQGDIILCNGEVAEISGFLRSDKIRITYLKSRIIAVIDPDSITMIIDQKLISRENIKTDLDLSVLPENLVLEAQRRFEILKKHLDAPHKTPPVLAISKELGLSVPHTYKIISRFTIEANLTSLICSPRGPKTGNSRLPKDIEVIIQTAIETSKGPDATITNIYKNVCKMCANVNIVHPSKKAVAARINRQKSEDTTKRRYGSKKSKQDHSVRGQKAITLKPLDLVQSDHCKVDCTVVDEVFRKEIARPWLTLMIDVHTRVVLGFYLTLEHPSALSNAMCMIHAVLPKNKWLEDLRMHDVEYPFYGLPLRIHVDNGKDFRSKAFMTGCSLHGINLTFRPPAAPHYGAHIERLIGTFMKRVRGLPGATLASVEEKKKYSNIPLPAMTLSELREWITEQIGIYHKETHESLGCSPQYYWETCFKDKQGNLTVPDLIINKKKFLIDFLPYKLVKLQRAGVTVNTIEYYSPALTTLSVKTPCIVRYNPASLATVWVLPEGSNDYIECTYSDMRLRDISLSEFTQAKKELTKKDRARISPNEVFAAIDRSTKIVSDASQKTKQARLNAERRKHRPHISLEEPAAQINTTLDYSRPPKIYDVD